MPKNTPISLCALFPLLLASAGIANAQGAKSAINQEKRVRFVILLEDQADRFDQELLGQPIRSELKKAGCVVGNAAPRPHDLILWVEPEISKMRMSMDVASVRTASATVGGQIRAIRDGATIATAEFQGEGQLDCEKLSDAQFKASLETCARAALKNSDFRSAIEQILSKAFPRRMK